MTTIVAAALRLAVPLEQRREVDVQELVAVQRVDVTLLPPRAGGETQAAAAPERLRLRHRHDLGPSPDSSPGRRPPARPRS